MKNLYAVFILFLSSLFTTQSFAQKSMELLLRTETIELQANLENFVNNYNSTVSSYQIIQFNSIPSNEAKANLKNAGIEFLEYVPNMAFIVKFSPLLSNVTFLKSYDIKGVYELPIGLKLDYRLIDWNIPQHAIAANSNAKVAVIAMNGLNIKSFTNELELENMQAYAYGSDERFGYFELNEHQINQLVKKSWVRSIELIDEPGKPESTEGRALQKSNVINNDLNNGLSYDASGVSLLVRDDGLVGPHIDYEGRLTNLTTDATGTHGDGVAGVMGAAGNIDPSIEGGASGADIYVINYVASFQDNTLSLHQNNDVMITNSSYSNGCNAGYTSTSQTVDQQVFDNQTLMHVFSAGNSNNTDCGYGAGDQWGNITGGHKVGKNVIAVANLFNDASIVSSSSRGPAHDGRIKPDLAAHGQGQMSTDPNNQYAAFGGTSSAAPSLAGNLGQLYEAYRDLNNNTNPKSALIKAAAMNSATDLGNAGPDFIYGYGLINTARAYDILANNQYLFSTISQADTNNHTITVPAGTGQLRIMLYWHDPEATINTNKALVNDLDLVVNGTLLPLVLDPTPNATTLDNPAVPGADHLNNIEQVVIDNPAAGTYAIEISGFQIPSGPQEYVVVYTFIEDDIKVTYPIGGESLIPNKGERIHWDAYGNTGTFNLDYSTDNGATWTNFSNAPGDERNAAWTVPNVNTADALVRVTRGTQSDQSDAGFNVFPIPSFTIQNNNATSIEINWASIAGASKYYIWQLGPKYMEIIDSSTTNQYVLGGLMGGENLWLSVSANSSTITGERANAQNFTFDPFSSCSGCISSINAYPFTESFEAGFGSFCNFQNDDIDFIENSGNTPTNNSGPNFASDGIQYIYLEASNPNFPLKDAVLGSPCFDLSNVTNAQLKFDYHMYGSGMGTLDVETSIDGGQTWSSTAVWSKLGDQGNQWFTDSVDFSTFQTNKFSFRFAARSGTSARSDIALDNIIFTADYPVSVTDYNSSEKYTIQPNPSNGNFYLNSLENLRSAKVINSFGQTITNISLLHTDKKMINLIGNAPGVYFVVLQDKNNRYHRIKISLL